MSPRGVTAPPLVPAELFKRNGIELVLSSRVTGVSESSVSILGKEGAASELRFGACVWATGVAMNPLIKSLQVHILSPSLFVSCVVPAPACGRQAWP